MMKGAFGMKKWILAGVIFSVWIGLIFSFACTRRGGMHSPNTLIIGIARDWRACDIWLHRGENCLVFETLIKRDREGGYIPFIAESWEKSEDGQDYTFRIKKGVAFSDGTKVTAYHVKESFLYIEKSKEMLKTANGYPEHYQSQGRNKEGNNKEGDNGDNGDKGNNGNNRNNGNNGNNGDNKESGDKEGSDKGLIGNGLIDNVAYNLPRWSEISSVEILDEYTIRIHLQQPYNLFLDELATTHISPILKPSPDEKVQGFIGTGPYIICEQKGTQDVLLVRNPHYWRGEVKIPRICLKVIPDPKTRVSALKTGDIDLTGIDSTDQIPLDMIPKLKASHLSVEKLSSIDPAVHYLALNYQEKLFADINVRKAIAMTISQNKINDLIHESALSIDGPVPQNNALYNQQIIRRRNNVSGARQMLAEAGWTGRSADGTIMKDGKKFSVTLLCNCSDPIYKAVAEGIQTQLQGVGIAVRVQHVELSEQIERMRNRTFEMVLWPQMRYPMFYYTKCPSWLNVYQSTELDDAFSVFLYSNDPDESRQAFYTTQELITDSCVQPLFFEVFNVVAWNNTRLLEFEPFSLSWNLDMDLWKAKLSRSLFR
jgi:ABC-type transport system substrate-binding protein